MKDVRTLILQFALTCLYLGLPVFRGMAMAEEKEGGLIPEGKLLLISHADQDITLQFSTGGGDAGELFLLRHGERATVSFCPPRCLTLLRTGDYVDSNSLKPGGRYLLSWDNAKQAWTITELDKSRE
jgi:hypothetical protein